jgi:hypothetical protein
MGHRVATIGHMDVRPALNDAEFGYLTGLAETRRWSRTGGEFVVPMGPFGFGEDDDAQRSAEVNRSNTPPGRQPGLWCPWVPDCAGRCLLIREEGTDGKNYGIVPWLSYLIDTFLAPAARAQGEPGFEDFTFDHEVSGVVAMLRNDTGGFSLVRAAGGRVWEEQIRRDDPAPWAM